MKKIDSPERIITQYLQAKLIGYPLTSQWLVKFGKDMLQTEAVKTYISRYGFILT